MIVTYESPFQQPDHQTLNPGAVFTFRDRHVQAPSFIARYGWNRTELGIESAVEIDPKLLSWSNGEETRVWGDGAYQGQTEVIVRRPERGILPSSARAQDQFLQFLQFFA